MCNIASGAERCQSARTAMLLSVQLGTEFDLPSAKPILTTAMNDVSIPVMDRVMVHYLLASRYQYIMCILIIFSVSMH